MRAIVIGCGIGGLSAAIGLRRIGLDVTVYERAPELREVGAGIGLWASAVRALDCLGAGEAVRAVSQPVRRGELRSERGHRDMVAYDAGEQESRRRLPQTVWMAHRADLVGALHALLPAETTRFGHALVHLEQDATGVTARFDNGHTDRADLLIGADGLHSAVRVALFGRDEPRYAGYTAWRGVCPAPIERVRIGSMAEVWGVGQRFGITSLPRGRSYWWACANAPPGQTLPDERTHLQDLYRDWADPVPWLIDATPCEAVVRNDVFDRPPMRSWHRGRAVLLGDAAHPTTPNLGMGGCMAMEDAAVLARQIAIQPDLAGAFRHYFHDRIGRTSRLTKVARSFGWIGQLENPPLCRIRDCLVGLTPKSVAFGSMLRYTRFDPGALPQQPPFSARDDAGSSDSERVNSGRSGPMPL